MDADLSCFEELQGLFSGSCAGTVEERITKGEGRLTTASGAKLPMRAIEDILVQLSHLPVRQQQGRCNAQAPRRQDRQKKLCVLARDQQR
jgi:hypothetical protein